MNILENFILYKKKGLYGALGVGDLWLVTCTSLIVKMEVTNA